MPDCKDDAEPKCLVVGTLPTRIYFRVIGWLDRERIHLSLVGGDGMYWGDRFDCQPTPTWSIDVDIIPPDKRFPNTLVGLERIHGPHGWRYIEPKSASSP